MPGPTASHSILNGSRSKFDRLSIVMIALTAALLAFAIMPLFLVRVPAMLDYPNHLARMYLLSGTPSLAYEPAWRVCPNLAMDLIVPTLARFMDVAIAAKVFWGASSILIVSGAVFLELTVKGRHRLGGLGAMLALSSLPFAFGEANFGFGLGLAVWSLGLWIRLRERSAWLRWTVGAVAVAALFVAHMLALGVYGLAIGLFELSRFSRRPRFTTLASLTAFMVSPVIIALAVMALFGGGVGRPAFDWMFDRKLPKLAMFLNYYHPMLALLEGAVGLGAAMLFAVDRRLRFTRAGAWVLVGFLLVCLILPERFFDSWGPDTKVLGALPVLLPAFTNISLPRGPWRVASLALVVGVIIANQVGTTWIWFAYQKDYQELEATFPLLTPGSTVLVGVGDRVGVWDQPMFHVPTLAAPVANVFVSSLFTVPGEQPIQPKPAYRDLDMAAGSDRSPPSVSSLMDIAAGGARFSEPNLARWPQRYNYLYVIGEPAPNPLPGTLSELTIRRRFTLYRVNTAAARSPAGFALSKARP